LTKGMDTMRLHRTVHVLMVLFVSTICLALACNDLSDADMDSNDNSHSTSDADSDGDSDTDSDGDSDTDTEEVDTTPTDDCLDGVWEGDFAATGEDDLTDLQGCSEITGSLRITDSTISNLDVLDGLRRVNGDVHIFKNSALTSIEGLHGLSEIGGDLWIGTVIKDATDDGYVYFEGNPVLASMTGLEGITAISGDLDIVGNHLLTDLQGLNNLVSVSGNVRVVRNDGLLNMAGFDNLQTVGAALLLALIYDSQFNSDFPSAQVAKNPVLKSLSGLGRLKTVGGEFLLMSEKIETLDGLSTLQSVGHLKLGDCLDEGEDEFDCGGNSTLKDIRALSSLTDAGSISVILNPMLQNLNGCENIRALESLLIGDKSTYSRWNDNIGGNIRLQSLDGFSGLTSVSHLGVFGNTSLPTCLIEEFIAQVSFEMTTGSRDDYVAFNNDDATCN
jgi:hypothetical protein